MKATPLVTRSGSYAPGESSFSAAVVAFTVAAAVIGPHEADEGALSILGSVGLFDVI